MKKVLIALAALVLVIGIAFAESIDLSGLTDEELATLYRRINQEYADRGIEKSARVEGGVYYAVKDIPTGEYLITVDNSERETAALLQIENRTGEHARYEMCSAAPKGTSQIYTTIYEGDKIYGVAPMIFTIDPKPITFE